MTSGGKNCLRDRGMKKLDRQISYNKLWKLLIDRDMKKKKLQDTSGISAALIAKMRRNGNITTEVLLKICIALDCDISDICEVERK